MFYSLNEKLRILRINPSCRGVLYISEVLEGKKKIEELNDDQVELIVVAWDSRKYVPHEIFKNLKRKVKPEYKKKETREQYYRRFAENIIQYLGE